MRASSVTRTRLALAACSKSHLSGLDELAAVSSLAQETHHSTVMLSTLISTSLRTFLASRTGVAKMQRPLGKHRR